VTRIALGTLVDISKGKKPTSLTVTPTGKARRFLQINDLRGEPPLRFTEDNGVEANPEDVLIAWDGANAGTVGWGLGGLIGSTLARLRPRNHHEVFSPYLGRFLSSKFHVLNGSTTGATIPHVDRVTLDKLTVPLPALDEQRRIAGILDKAHAFRNKCDESIRLADQLLRSAFDKVFGDPTRNPKGWALVQLGDLCSEIVDCPHATPTFTDSGVGHPCLRTSDLQNGRIDLSTTKWVRDDEYTKRIARAVPSQGDVVYSREGERFGIAAIIPAGISPCLGQRMMMFRVNLSVATSAFLWALLNSTAVYSQARAQVGGSTSPHVNVGAIRRFRVFRPPIELQHRYSQIFDSVDSIYEHAQQRRDLGESLSESLTHRAFRGEL
jgi:type I restriction enzyme S subunit